MIQNTDYYMIEDINSAYSQSVNNDSFTKLNESLKQALHLISGLDYVMKTTTDTFNYFALVNGLYYASPHRYKNYDMEPWYPLDSIQESCFLIDPPLTDPPPMKGYDPRCRPWF